MKKIAVWISGFIISVLIIKVLSGSFVFANEIAEESILSKKAEENLTKMCETVDGVLLLEGWVEAFKNEYDTSVLTSKEKDDFIVRGAKNLADRIEFETDERAKLYGEVLARHYALKNDLKKEMYWSFKAAEKGSSFCMRIISNAYRSGEGVVQDLAEGIKWTYLGAAAGNDWCKQWVKEYGEEAMMNEYARPAIIEAQKRANEWMQKHPDVFFSP